MLRLEQSKKDHFVNSFLAAEMHQSLNEAFFFDHKIMNENKNLDFYFKLTPRMQTELIRELFGGFIDNFAQFFSTCESHFVNEMVISMYSRIYEGYTDIVKYKKNFK